MKGMSPQQKRFWRRVLRLMYDRRLTADEAVQYAKTETPIRRLAD